MRQTDYAWWKERIAAAARLFDVIRIDHFRGLESYWAIPYGDKTARGGKVGQGTWPRLRPRHAGALPRTCVSLRRISAS